MPNIHIPIPLGTIFNRLTVIDGPIHLQSRPWYLCRCRCDTEKIVQGKDLRQGRQQSCGCLQRDHPNGRKHGEGAHGNGRTVEFDIWSGIKKRCYTTTSRFFKNYGGRGITVCDRWRNSYVNFLADMGRRPTPKHSIDRIDNDGPYSPENCRWADAFQQASNRRNTRNVTYQGRTQTLADWAREFGIDYYVLHTRLRFRNNELVRCLSSKDPR